MLLPLLAAWLGTFIFCALNWPVHVTSPLASWLHAPALVCVPALELNRAKLPIGTPFVAPADGACRNVPLCPPPLVPMAPGLEPSIEVFSTPSGPMYIVASPDLEPSGS